MPGLVEEEADLGADEEVMPARGFDDRHRQSEIIGFVGRIGDRLGRDDLCICFFLNPFSHGVGVDLAGLGEHAEEPGIAEGGAVALADIDDSRVGQELELGIFRRLEDLLVGVVEDFTLRGVVESLEGGGDVGLHQRVGDAERGQADGGEGRDQDRGDFGARGRNRPGGVPARGGGPGRDVSNAEEVIHVGTVLGEGHDGGSREDDGQDDRGRLDAGAGGPEGEPDEDQDDELGVEGEDAPEREGPALEVPGGEALGEEIRGEVGFVQECDPQHDRDEDSQHGGQPGDRGTRATAHCEGDRGGEEVDGRGLLGEDRAHHEDSGEDLNGTGRAGVGRPRAQADQDEEAGEAEEVGEGVGANHQAEAEEGADAERLHRAEDRGEEAVPGAEGFKKEKRGGEDRGDRDGAADQVQIVEGAIEDRPESADQEEVEGSEEVRDVGVVLPVGVEADAVLNAPGEVNHLGFEVVDLGGERESVPDVEPKDDGAGGDDEQRDGEENLGEPSHGRGRVLPVVIVARRWGAGEAVHDRIPPGGLLAKPSRRARGVRWADRARIMGRCRGWIVRWVPGRRLEDVGIRLRKMGPWSVLVLVAGGMAVSAFAEDRPGPAIDATRMLDHIRTLSSDEFEGRAPATARGARTVAYLVEQFRKLGLAPGNPDGSYVQEVPLVGYRTEASGALRLGDRTIALGSSEAWSPSSRRPEAEVSVPDSEVVFVGYGVEAPEQNWDDFKGLDARGKTLVMLVGDPPVPDPDDPSRLDPKVFGGRAMTYYGRWTYKFEIASKKGAAAVFVVHETGPAGYPWAVPQSSYGREHFDIPSPELANRVGIESWISLETAKALFGTQERWEELKARAATREFRPVSLGARFDGKARNTRREVKSQNVVARVVGSDPELRDEHVVYTAHWDHLGRDESLEGDQIYNGAADNASGTAMLLELARAFAETRPAPKRSVLFLAVTAEEQGLLGALSYAANPLYPIEKTVANINMDVVNLWGRTSDVTSVGMGQSTMDDLLVEVAGAQGRTVGPDPEPEKGLYYRSDHFAFAQVGVPALNAKGGSNYIGKPAGYGQRKRDEYTKNDYHKPSDEVKPDWDLAGAAEDAGLLYEVGLRVANGVTPEWKPTSEFRSRRQPGE